MVLARLLFSCGCLLLSLSLGLSSASAQYIPGAVEKWCKAWNEAKAKLPLVEADYDIVQNSRGVLQAAADEARATTDSDRFLALTGAADRQSTRADRLYREIVWLKGTIENWSDICTDEVARQSGTQPPQERRPAANGTVVPNAEALIRRAKRALATAEQIIAASRRELAAIASRYPEFAGRLQRRRPGPRIEVAGFLGGSLSLNDPNLDPFNQKLKRGAGPGGGGEIVFAWPLADRFDLRLGGTVFHSSSDAQRIDNVLVPGSLPVTGHYDTTALLGTVGFGFQPIDRWYVTLDGGLGAGFNDLLIRNPATGATIISNRETVTAGMVRVALTYAVTDQLRVGGFLSHIRTGSMNAQVTGGPPVDIGHIYDTTAGVTLIFVSPPIFLP